ncbi:type I polyketide synthase [Pectobacterium versatile]|uniref:type I polyketide synthase n=1 Tax=Pectobacterium versatile TaxID=2488639 RepID=UPI001CCDBF45|nr:type I polyketide synthase [Pectobacterium versatile]
MTERHESCLNMSIAIIGMGCRFPGGANSPERYWQLLMSGTDPITPIPPVRWSSEAYSARDRNLPGRSVAKEGGFLDDVAGFDPGMFGISSSEAAFIDPQHRLMLQTSREALESARIVPSSLAGSATGVYVGAFTHDYLHMQLTDLREASGYTSTGAMGTMASSRVSYAFDLRGPSMTLDTACSSSLLAVHLACESLRRGESHLALAGGCQLMLIPDFCVAESRTGFLSLSNRCHSFSAAADGYVRSEGIGVVVLKPLVAALRDGNPVLAVIRGSASNQDGRTPTITQPNVHAQQAVIRAACDNAGIAASELDYVEAHGTGTPVGDPIEAEAIGTVCRKEDGSNRVLLVGSCKSVIGHTEAAAGIAGLIKTVLCLQHRRVPGNLHSLPPNPNIAFDDLSLKVPDQPEPLPVGRCLAGVNSFGFGGTNVHVVLETAPPAMPVDYVSPVAGRAGILPLTAHSPESLKQLGEQLAGVLERPGVTPQDMAYSCALTRDRLPLRKGIAFTSRDDLLAKLHHVTPCSAGAQMGRLAWVFPGLGTTHWAMAVATLEKESVFAETFGRCAALWRSLSGESLYALLQAPGEVRSQVVQFSVQVALAKQWQAWGIQPAAVLGHSAGEVAAFHLAGVYDLEQSISLLYWRCRVLDSVATDGGMLVVAAGREQIGEILAQHPAGCAVGIAGSNGPRSCVLSGGSDALRTLAGVLKQHRLASRPISGRLAFHSTQLEGIRHALTEDAERLSASLPSLPLFSSVSGTAIEQAVGGKYWAANLIDPFQFDRALDVLLRAGYHHVLEVSPTSVLSGVLTKAVQPYRGKVFACRAGKDWNDVLGELFDAGHEPDWHALFPGAQYIDLPSYPWNSTPHWREPSSSRERRLRPRAGALLGEKLKGAGDAWESEVIPEQHPWLADHKVLDEIMFPAAGYLEMILAAAREVFTVGEIQVRSLELTYALTLEPRQACRFQTFLNRATGDVQIHATKTGGEPLYQIVARASLCSIPAGIQAVMSYADQNAVGVRYPIQLLRASLYDAFAMMRYSYGPTFQTLREAYVGDQEVVCHLDLPDPPEGMVFHPAALDGVFQCVLVCDAPGTTELLPASQFTIPVSVSCVHLFGVLRGPVTVYATKKRVGNGEWQGWMSVYSAGGDLLCRVDAFRVRLAGSLQREISTLKTCRLEWVAVPAITQSAGIRHWAIVGNGEWTRALAAELDRRATQVCQMKFPQTTDGVMQLVEQIPVETEAILLVPPQPISQDVTHQLIRLCQLLAVRPDVPRLWVMTRNLYSPSGGNPESDLRGAGLWGMLRVIGQQEAPGLWGGAVDVDDASTVSSLWDAILCDDGEDQIVLRDAERYVARLREVEEEGCRLPPSFRCDGAYVITGALGDIGSVVTRWMVERGARHLLLLGRRPVLGAEDEARLSTLRALGAEMVYLSVDLADASATEAALRQYRQASGLPLLGLMHCAAYVEDQRLPELDPAVFDQVFAAKAQSAWTLHSAMLNDPLEHFVLFSSLGSLVALPGMAAYAAANSALDHLALWRRRQGLPALALNWGPWNTGIAQRDARTLPVLAGYGLLPLTAQVALNALEHHFSAPDGQRLLFGADWMKMQASTLHELPLLRGIWLRRGIARSEDTSIAPVGNVDDVIVLLRRLCARVLDVPEDSIAPDLPLAESGIDSLNSLMIVHEINQSLHVEVSLDEVLSVQSLSELAVKVLYRMA